MGRGVGGGEGRGGGLPGLIDLHRHVSGLFNTIYNEKIREKQF